MKIRSLGLKVSLIVALMIALIVVIIVVIVSNQSMNLITELTQSESEIANAAFAKEIEKLQQDAATRARIVASSHDVVNSILEGDEPALKSALLSLKDQIDTIMVADENGIVLSRAHNDTVGDSVLSQAIVTSTLNTGVGSATVAAGSTVGLSTRGSAAIRDFDGNIIGVVVCSHDLSNPEYVDDIKESTGSEVTIFNGDTRLMTTMRDDKGDRAVGTKASDEVIDVVINKRQEYSLRISLFGSEYYAHYSPFIVNGDVVGMLFTGIHIDQSLIGQRNMMTMVIIVGVVCGVACLLLVILFSLLSVSRPLKKIGAYAEKIKVGDIGVSEATAATIKVNSSDEIGRLARSLEQAYAQLRGYVGEIRDRMDGLANGDLTTESTYEFHGDFIMIKDSINGIVRNLNRIMTEVNHSSAQVSTGAKQVADGAQALAQGSTEQAATVEQLSSSIAAIAQKTIANAGMADKAASLADTIIHNAETGSRHMDDMMAAVKDINQASQSISKVIKVIDDIAFQTNILALNAAVEAARAGQHGKGFAVVAEEVRNLAAKSAEAAKDTGGLIADSMVKAELGAKIANETAESLTEIVTGINDSSQLISEIAKSSEEQSAGIAEINNGIDQVAQVVQQNSATAQQSAAASEEMSSQSDILQDLISQFHLSHHDSKTRSLPEAGRATQRRTEKDTGAFTGNFGKY